MIDNLKEIREELLESIESNDKIYARIIVNKLDSIIYNLNNELEYRKSINWDKMGLLKHIPIGRRFIVIKTLNLLLNHLLMYNKEEFDSKFVAYIFPLFAQISSQVTLRIDEFYFIINQFQEHMRDYKDKEFLDSDFVKIRDVLIEMFKK